MTQLRQRPQGELAKEEVDADRLLEILLHHLDRIESDLREDEEAVGEEMIAQAALNCLAKVFFLKLCEERNLSQEEFPLVYREDAYDLFRPSGDTVAGLVDDLSTKSFARLTNEDVGSVYQGLLSSRRRGGAGRSGRQFQAKLGAFYTPSDDVAYMVSKLGLTADSRVLDPCVGAGHFLEGIYKALIALHLERGVAPADAHREVVSRQIYGGDVDGFAASLAAVRMFLLDEHGTGARPNLYLHDMLLHSPERPGDELFGCEGPNGEITGRIKAEPAVRGDVDVDELQPIDEVEFDAVVGNPPYGARTPEHKRSIYARRYGAREADRKVGSAGTGDKETYSMFFANAIERLREGGRACLITSDSFRTLTTHAALRRHLLDRCKIVEILLTDARHFEGVSFKFAGMAITTLEKCSDEDARRGNTMRLVDHVSDPARFSDPDPALVTELRQEDYEALPETPFFVGVPGELVQAAKGSARVGDFARGRVGLQTGDDRRFLAGIGTELVGLQKVVSLEDLAGTIAAEEQAKGIPPNRPHWVPFAKGEGFGEYWRGPRVAIDWSQASVRELERRAGLAAGTARKTYFRNRDYFFRPALTYSVISSGRVSARLMPEGWVFGHKGSAIFPVEGRCSSLFLLGYLNSALATYFMKKMVNATATADVGYVEKLPYREPTAGLEGEIEERVAAIAEKLKADPLADVSVPRGEIDERIFDLFEVHESREAVRRFYSEIGKAR